MRVYTMTDEYVGEVYDVLVDPYGQVVAMLVEVGGFLGIGGSTVVLAWDRARLDRGRVVTGLTRDEVMALPRWD
jgi:sporulation protein YlmC with PRC-barrel domain